MKWHSVKKYKTAQSMTTCMVITECGDCYIANSVKFEDGWKWDVLGENSKILNNVTHFCIPDPIPIDD